MSKIIRQDYIQYIIIICVRIFLNTNELEG